MATSLTKYTVNKLNLTIPSTTFANWDSTFPGIWFSLPGDT